ncbi:hypothetical protein GOBAR_AA13077 [Gossypium barbadense]|uniref:Uncharacterized protein n=1 Tax=Gossypium barbadense TaxID=3634 RepID=A0A2P5XW82_GOSBA|nr:hypothetical protein GOBAR_AA13077 [Gossypium barbadense]
MPNTIDCESGFTRRVSIELHAFVPKAWIAKQNALEKMHSGWDASYNKCLMHMWPIQRYRRRRYQEMRWPEGDIDQNKAILIEGSMVRAAVLRPSGPILAWVLMMGSPHHPLDLKGPTRMGTPMPRLFP